MAQKSIREFTGKKLLKHYLHQSWSDFPSFYPAVEIDSEKLPKTLPVWEMGYFAKPDELFGKRGKLGLTMKSNTSKEILDWIKTLSAKTTVIKNSNGKTARGKLQTFLVEPFLKHGDEFYVAFKTERTSDTIYFSGKGGVDVEENWNDIKKISVPFSQNTEPLADEYLKKLLSGFKNKDLKLIAKFIAELYRIFRMLDFTYLEINPFTVVSGRIIMLDLVARMDDTAAYKNEKLYAVAGGIEFPHAFGSVSSTAEEKIAELDARSGASLKFKILNPEGRIWMLTSGGGGSVIFADTVGDLGHAGELANYGEYSGNPTTDETSFYTDTVLGEMLKSKAKDKVLIIGGGIANFTDVKETFKGVIAGIEKHSSEIKKQKIRIFVRRGGPNYQTGLGLIKSELTRLGISIDVHTPDTYMTEIIKFALNS
jgi:ATP-citrate lyase beta-subunit